MIKREFYFPSADSKTKIHAIEWIPEGKPVAVIQVAHGVTEHILRYEAFAKYMTQKGFVIVGNDHLGHGTSIAKNSKPMYFGPAGSWNTVVEDLHICKNLTQKRFSNIPYCLLGFSLGSFLVRTYLIQYSDTVDAAILIGTGQIAPLQNIIAKFIANYEAHKAGEEYSTPMIQKLTFETYNKIFQPNRTEFDWLCSNPQSVDAYIADPLRGGNLSTGLFRELLSGMEFTGKIKNMKKMNSNIPMLLLSGGKDPVGECGRGVRCVYGRLCKAGIKDINMKLYPGLRHDILNEDCREQIYEDLCRWMEGKLIK